MLAAPPGIRVFYPTPNRGDNAPMGLIQSLTGAISFGTGAAVGVDTGVRISFLKQPRPLPHQWSALLDHPLRLRYRDPAATLGPYGIAAGMHLLDLGCGTGTFTVEMARLVGETGKVHAVDIQKPMLDKAKARVEAAGLGNRVVFHHSGAYRLPLPDQSIDLALLIATLPEIPDRVQALNEVRRVLKDDGRLVLSEEMLHPAYVPASLERRWLRLTGFRYAGQLGTPFCYSLVYAKG
jgi:SAM-dependent methyltransferase